MNHIDAAIIVIILASFLIGWKLRGVYVIIIPAAFFAGVFFANLTFGIFAKALAAGVPNEAKRHLIGYSISFIIGASVIVLAGIFLARGFDFFKLTFVDRILGALILITAMLLPLYMLIIFLDRQVHFNLFGFHEGLKKSLLFPKIEKYSLLVLKLPLLKHLRALEAILK
ncbi:MAG TPA: CvpA family protein [Candidatus Goldiibacteriota bacterium]|nr:CvpA family protein [Candidatus Goldiibacteriota bacterium]